MYKHHHQAERHEPLGLLDEDRGSKKQWVSEESEHALHAVLLLVGPDHLLVGELGRVEHIGGCQKGCFALDRSRKRVCVNRDGGLDLPQDAVGRRALARASGSVLLGMEDELGLDREPRWSSGSQAKRWLPNCQSCFSQWMRVVSNCRVSVARTRSSPWVVRTTSQRSPAGACGGEAQKRSPSCCQAASATVSAAFASVDVSGTRLIQRTPVALRRATFSAL
jgi:hypothetical protein